MQWNVYLSGEIHTDWREQIKEGTKKLNLPDTFLSSLNGGVKAVFVNNGNEFALISTDGGLYWANSQLSNVNNLSMNGLGVSQYYSTSTMENYPNCETISCKTFDECFEKANKDSSIRSIIPLSLIHI